MTLPDSNLKIIHFGGFPKTLAKPFSKPHEVSRLFDESENSVSCDYSLYEMNKIKLKEKDLSVLHLNISSLSTHIDYLKNFLSELRIKFDMICISESKLSQKNPQTTNLIGYNIGQTPTESSPSVVPLYISQKFS